MDELNLWLNENAGRIADELAEMNTGLALEGRCGFGMKQRAIAFLDNVRAALFPSLYEAGAMAAPHLAALAEIRLYSAAEALVEIAEAILRDRDKARSLSVSFLKTVPEIRRLLTLDLQAAYDGDPAARSRSEILLSYPCIEAISAHRIAHKLYRLNLPILPRILSEYAHMRTGIDIHPGASIGTSFFIDHGTGVVIGETAVIGNRVKIYQGVTLGAKSFQLDESGKPVKGVKRHPNIEDDVVIYAGATILGGDVTIGKGSVIGGNAWITHSVAPFSMVYNPSPRTIINPLGE